MAEKKTTRRDFLRTSAAAASAAALSAIAPRAFAGGSDAIRIGVVGCGGRGPGAALNAMGADPGVRLVALADLFLPRVHGARGSLQRQKPNQVAVDDAHCFAGLDGYRRVIESVDVVLIACAAKFHPMYMRAAIEAGKHVFVEKPHAIDPAGVQEVTAACDVARQRRLCVVSGLHSRYEPGYRETVRRIHDGAIGDVVAIEENFLRAPYGLYGRAAGMSEVQYQFSNQYHFAWLSGDDVTQSLVHNLDRAEWVLREQPPVKCHGLGGRSSLHGDVFGNVFDHHSVVYEYASGVRIYAFCRTIERCYGEYSSLVFGTRGRCNLMACRIEGENRWHYQPPPNAPRLGGHDLEHHALFAAIRSGNPINNGDYMARGTLVAVMGQFSCYTGQEITWAQITRSNALLGPRPEQCTFDMDPPVRPDPSGIYPVPIPGTTTLL